MDRVRRSIARLSRRNGRGGGNTETGHPSKEGGHGDHWGCILRAAEQDELLGFISKVIEEAERPEVFEAAGAGLAVHAPGERVGACVLVVNNKLVTAYPEAQGGTIWPVTVSEMIPWANGIEGQITGTCHGAAVSFFDTRFYANRRRYRVGESYDFCMAAFAYRLGRADDMEVFDPDLGAKVSLRGAHAFMPAGIDNESADIDDYWFHSPLEGEVSTAELAGKCLRVYPVTIALPEEFELRTDLYAGEHVIASDILEARPGEDLEGFLWLQGHLA